MITISVFEGEGNIFQVSRSIADVGKSRISEVPHVEGTIGIFSLPETICRGYSMLSLTSVCHTTTCNNERASQGFCT